MPSRRRWGSPSMTARSMKAPGSPSSALQMRYFWRGLLPAGDVPLLARREPAAAAAPEARALHGVAHLLGREARQRLMEGSVAAPRHVLVEARRVDDAAVGQDPAGLGREEGVVLEARDLGPGFEAGRGELPDERGPLHLTRPDAVQEGGHLVFGDASIAHARAAGELDVHEGLVGAEADAAHLHHVGVDAACAEVLADGLQGLARPGAEAAGPRAHEDHGALEALAAERVSRAGAPSPPDEA